MTAYRVYIYLAANEWGNELMRKVAADYATEHADKWPLIVSVHEHAGWHLSFLYGAPHIANGTVCGTANDMATLSQAVIDFGQGISGVEILGEIRR
jgi:hypothetical protein